MKSPVMIVGAPRSGTSMIMSIFKNFLGYKGHNEGHFFTLLYRILNLTIDHQRNLRISDGDHKNTLVLDENLNIQTDLKKLFCGYLETMYGQESWFIKTPNNLAIKSIPLVRSMFPDLKIIYMKRRGIENVLSQSRKFGQGHFKPYYCQMWSDCIESFFGSEQPPQTLIIDQLALITDPQNVISKVINFIEFDGNENIATRIEEYMKVNLVENTAPLTKYYIPLEETPWTSNEKEIFLEQCESAMRQASYPITRDEIRSFQPDESFLFPVSGNNIIQVKNISNPWTKVPWTLSETFKIHPNIVGEEPVSIIIKPPFQDINIQFDMVNPNLKGKGVTIDITEKSTKHSKITHLASFDLHCFDKRHIKIKKSSVDSTLVVKVSNEIGSNNAEYKQFLMNIHEDI